ncbi:MAG: hypothetical protein WD490_05470 [Opitutales bacterium]
MPPAREEGLVLTSHSYIAGMPGGANLPLYDALGSSRLIHH